MINAIIIDDEPHNIVNMAKLLQEYCAQVNVLATATNAADARTAILQHQPDLLFLDIQMPDENGFDLLKSIKGFNFEVIFVTAYDKYGIQAVKFAAIDYLLKPVNIIEMKEAVEKVLLKKQQARQNLQLENLLQLLQQSQSKELHRIALPTAKETRFINPAQIIRCESSNNYTTFFLQDGEKILVSKPIFEYEELLVPYGFLRCHRSHLVNKKFIKSMIKEHGGSLILEDGTQLPTNKQKLEELKQYFVYGKK